MSVYLWDIVGYPWVPNIIGYPRVPNAVGYPRVLILLDIHGFLILLDIQGFLILLDILGFEEIQAAAGPLRGEVDCGGQRAEGIVRQRHLDSVNTILSGCETLS